MLRKILTLFTRKVSLHFSPILTPALFISALFLAPLPAFAIVVGLNINQFMGAFDTAGQGFTKELGTHSVRVGYLHGDHDFGVNWAAQNGTGVLFFLGYGKGCSPSTPSGRQCYADRSAQLAQKYGNKVQYYEVWNEWNIGLGHGGPGSCPGNGGICADTTMYTDLLCRTYKAIKAVQPNAKVVGSVSAGASLAWNGRMLDAGAGKCMDMISVHPYVYQTNALFNVPSNAPGSVGADKLIEAVTAVHNLVKQKTGKSMQVLVTETGRLNSPNPQIHADYITHSYQKGKSVPFFEGIWWYALEETGPGRYGLVTQGNAKTPAFFAFQAVAKGTPNTGPSPTGPPLPPPPPPGPHVTLTVTPACFP